MIYLVLALWVITALLIVQLIRLRADLAELSKRHDAMSDEVIGLSREVEEASLLDADQTSIDTWR